MAKLQARAQELESIEIEVSGNKETEIDELERALHRIINEDFGKRQISIDAIVCGHSVMLSRTGYTGELGFEIYASNQVIVDIWKALHDVGVVPCGLASRDILRMEMKYCLYGNDIDEDKTPLEAGLNWIVKLSKIIFRKFNYPI